MEEKEVSFVDLSFLTDRQKQVYLLRSAGVKFKDIATTLGISQEAARQHAHHAERRFREKERYDAMAKRNNEVIDLPITRGELKMAIQGLREVEKEMMKHKRPKDDWWGSFPYEHHIITTFIEKAENYLYPKKEEKSRV